MGKGIAAKSNGLCLVTGNPHGKIELTSKCHLLSLSLSLSLIFLPNSPILSHTHTIKILNWSLFISYQLHWHCTYQIWVLLGNKYNYEKILVCKRKKSVITNLYTCIPKTVEGQFSPLEGEGYWTDTPQLL